MSDVKLLYALSKTEEDAVQHSDKLEDKPTFTESLDVPAEILTLAISNWYTCLLYHFLIIEMLFIITHLSFILVFICSFTFFSLPTSSNDVCYGRGTENSKVEQLDDNLDTAVIVKKKSRERSHKPGEKNYIARMQMPEALAFVFFASIF